MSDFKDISTRMKQLRKDADETPEAQPADPLVSFALRAKMLGVLLRDARLNAARSLDDCAHLLHLTAGDIEAWEYGDAVPSLPQLEILAAYLDVPISHFWGTAVLGEAAIRESSAQQEYMALRDRLIGALLRQAREEAGMSQQQMAEASAVSLAALSNYELGELAVPMHELTVLAGVVKKNVSYFLESSSHVGELLMMKEMWKHFMALPDEIRQFAANPVNVGFIEIAIMLSRMPVDRLRSVGASILDITR